MDRRSVVTAGAGAMLAAVGDVAAVAQPNHVAPMSAAAPRLPFIETADGARLFYNDFLSHGSDAMFSELPAELKNMSYEASLADKATEKTFLALSKDDFKRRVEPATFVPTQCGNMYCVSLYSGLCGLLSLVDSEQPTDHYGQFFWDTGPFDGRYGIAEHAQQPVTRLFAELTGVRGLR